MDKNLEIIAMSHESEELTIEQMFQMAEKEAEFGDCGVCEAKNVKVGKLTNVENPTLTMSCCFKCLRGNAKLTEEQKN